MKPATLGLLLLLYVPTAVQAEVLVVTLLGTGIPRPEVERFGSSVLIEANRQRLLIDAGRGSVQRLAQIYVPFQLVDKVFITHLHYDHIVGLPDFLLSGWVFQRQAPVSFWGPPALEAHLESLLDAYREDTGYRLQHDRLPDAGIAYQYRPVKAGVVYQDGELTVTAFEVNHHPVSPAYGYRVDYAGRSVVISGDTRYSKEVLRHAQGVDLLIHEVAAASENLKANNPRLRRILDYHTSPEDLASLLSVAQPKLAVLTHVIAFEVEEDDLLARVSANHQVPVRYGRDLMAFDVGDSIREYVRPQ